MAYVAAAKVNWHLRTPKYRGPQPAEQHPDDMPFEMIYEGEVNRLAVVCVFWGDKYQSGYVRKLAASVRARYPFPHDFYCVTADPVVIVCAEAWGVKVLPPATAEPGWWQKPGLFAPGLIPTCQYKPEELTGVPIGMHHCPGCGDMVVAAFPHPPRYVLYLDIDVVLTGGLGPLLCSVVPSGGLVMAENFGPNKPHCPHNSSAMLWRAGDCTELFTDYTPEVSEVLHGDQCWIWRRLDGRIREFPRELVRSYKYDCRSQGALPRDASVIVFHGKPDPHEELDTPWVRTCWGDL